VDYMHAFKYVSQANHHSSTLAFPTFVGFSISSAVESEGSSGTKLQRVHSAVSIL
jgi:hypothetical protein